MVFMLLNCILLESQYFIFVCVLQEYKETGCSDAHCKGSHMQLKPKRPYGSIRPTEEVLPLATDFIKQYYESKRM